MCSGHLLDPFDPFVQNRFFVPNLWKSFPPTGLGYSKNVQEIAIQNHLELLQIALNQLSTMVYKAISHHGSDLLRQNIVIQSVTSLEKLDVPKMRLLLHNAMLSFKDVQENSVFIEADIHHLFEECRLRQRKIKEEMLVLSNEREAKKIQIESHEESIREQNDLAEWNERQADRLERRAGEEERMSEESAVWGFVKVVGGGVLTYFTWGTYLVWARIGSISIMSGAKNIFYDSTSYRIQAQESREQAWYNRNLARDYEREVDRLEEEIENLETDIEISVHVEQELKRTMNQFEHLSYELRKSMDGMVEIYEEIENMNTALARAELHAASLKIIQKHSRNFSQLFKRAQEKNIHMVWSDIQKVVMSQQKKIS